MKAASAYRTISEVSETLGLPAHVLRFWESKFPQIQPMKRSGGRRFYRPQDIIFLERLQNLLHVQGYTIRGVQLLLRAERGKATPPPVTHDRTYATDHDTTLFSLPAAAPVITAAPPTQKPAPSLETLLNIRTFLLELRKELDVVRKRFISPVDRS